MKAVKTIFAIFLVLFFISGCGSEGGTNTGNPGTQNDDGTQSGGEESDGADDAPVADAAEPASEQILDSLCSKLTGCFSELGISDCLNGISTATNLADDLGITGNNFETYQDIIDAETGSEIVANYLALSACLADIELLLCESQEVQNAFNPNDPENFENIGGMIPAGENSCEGVF